jgi:hypothetical protein
MVDSLLHNTLLLLCKAKWFMVRVGCTAALASASVGWLSTDVMTHRRKKPLTGPQGSQKTMGFTEYSHFLCSHCPRSQPASTTHLPSPHSVNPLPSFHPTFRPPVRQLRGPGRSTETPIFQMYVRNYLYYVCMAVYGCDHAVLCEVLS